MESAREEWLKQRDLVFTAVQSEVQPARAAQHLLQGIDGILSAELNGELSLTIHYDLSIISLKAIEDALTEVGFHLDNNLLAKIMRALYYYTEETQLANHGYAHAESKSTTEIFINRYNQLQHGCRDDRPDYYHHVN